MIFQHRNIKIINLSRILWWFLYKSICELSSRSSNPKIYFESRETICVHRKTRTSQFLRKNFEEVLQENHKIVLEIFFGNSKSAVLTKSWIVKKYSLQTWWRTHNLKLIWTNEYILQLSYVSAEVVFGKFLNN